VSALANPAPKTNRKSKGGGCPICGKPISPDHRPFCSKRCADIDLGRWLKGGYAVPGDPVRVEDIENGKENLQDE
jgi:uncharacterized protein